MSQTVTTKISLVHMSGELRSRRRICRQRLWEEVRAMRREKPSASLCPTVPLFVISLRGTAAGLQKCVQSFKALIYRPSQRARLITFQLATTGFMFAQGGETSHILPLSLSVSVLRCHLCTAAPEGHLQAPARPPLRPTPLVYPPLSIPDVATTFIH